MKTKRRRNLDRLDEQFLRSWLPRSGEKYTLLTLIAPDPSTQSRVLSVVRDFVGKAGLPHRFPHHSVRHDGIVSEGDLAQGGVLYLDDFSYVEPYVLRTLANHLHDNDRSVLVIMVDSQRGLEESAKDLAIDAKRHLEDRFDDARVHGIRAAGRYVGPDLTLEWPIAPGRGLPSTAADEVAQALAVINRHRRSFGQRPLDPAAAGWTDEDVLLEAERIARLSNPKRARQLRRRLLQ